MSGYIIGEAIFQTQTCFIGIRGRSTLVIFLRIFPITHINDIHIPVLIPRIRLRISHRSLQRESFNKRNLILQRKIHIQILSYFLGISGCLFIRQGHRIHRAFPTKCIIIVMSRPLYRNIRSHIFHFAGYLIRSGPRIIQTVNDSSHADR